MTSECFYSKYCYFYFGKELEYFYHSKQGVWRFRSLLSLIFLIFILLRTPWNTPQGPLVVPKPDFENQQMLGQILHTLQYNTLKSAGTSLTVQTRESLFLSVYMKQKQWQNINFIHSPNPLSPLAGQQITAVSPCCQLVHIEEEKLLKIAICISEK